MQRTINHTGRKRIENSEVSFEILETTPLSFETNFTLDFSEYPEDAKVYVEAYYKETRQRFSYGTASKIVPPQNTVLNDIDTSGSTLFRILIVDESGVHGLLLASGDSFRAKPKDEDSKKSSLFSVSTKDIGQLVWKVDFPDNISPELYLNNKVPGVLERLKSDTTFQALILPAALKEILIHYIHSDPDEEDDSYKKWMGFSHHIAGEMPDDSGTAEKHEWVEEVVAEFANKFSLVDLVNQENKEEI